MRVLITNSLVLAAISLAPSASAAPYTTTSSVDAYESYPNSTAVAQESGPSSVPSMLYPYGRTLNLSRQPSPLDVRRDEIIRVQSLYDQSPFGNVFGPVADLFGSIGMNTISDNMPFTEAQKAVLDQLHNALHDAAGSVVAHLPASLPISPLASRSLEDRQIPNPLSTLGNLPEMGNSLTPLSDLLSSVGIGMTPTTPLTDLQKQVIAKLQIAISKAVGDVTATVPRLGVLPFSHQARSVEERSLGDIVSIVNQVPSLSSLLAPATNLIGDLGILNGTPLSDVQKEALSKLQAAIAEAVQDIKAHVPTIHIEHTREEREHWDHHDHHRDSHRDDHPHGEHKESDKLWEEHKDENRSRDEHKPHDAHKDDHLPHNFYEDGHKSPDAHKEDHGGQNAHREGDHCREPRDGQWDDSHKSDDCKHHRNGKDGDEGSFPLKISLGHSHHP